MVSSNSTNSLKKAAQLLDVSPEELKMSLTTRMMSAGGSDMRSGQHQHQILSVFFQFCF